ncbi:cytochrome c-type biogenesis protein [Shewanella maritima]|nr:cytochrome c-type biogenesis protein [Shewanella maritima]
MLCRLKTMLLCLLLGSASLVALNANAQINSTEISSTKVNSAPINNAAMQAPKHYTQEQIKTLGFEIAKELRCPASINQNLLDSQAPIANELKAEIFLQLEQGKSKQAIIEFMVARFGEQIHYMPTLNASTSALFIIPIFMVLLAIVWLVAQQMRQSRCANKLQGSPQQRLMTEEKTHE